MGFHRVGLSLYSMMSEASAGKMQMAGGWNHLEAPSLISSVFGWMTWRLGSAGMAGLVPPCDPSLWVGLPQGMVVSE